MKPEHELADIFRLFGEEYRKSHVMTTNQRKVMAAIACCRTAQLGGATPKYARNAAPSGTAITPAATDIARNARP